MKISTQDAIYNWLSIQVVVVQRPKDEAAIETAQLFYDILEEDYQITQANYSVINEKYIVSYLQNGVINSKEYPVDYVEVLLDQIESNPEQFRLYE